MQQISIGANGKVFTRNPGDLLDPRREPEEVLNKIRANMGSYAFTAQYLQGPVPPADQPVKAEWFRTYYYGSPSRSGDMILQSWDTAYKPDQQNDFSVCTTWLVRANLEEAYLLNVWRDRVDFPTLLKKVIELRAFYKANVVLVEEAASGISLIQTLKSQRHPVRGIRPDTDKLTRMSIGSAAIEAGCIFLPTKKLPLARRLYR